MVKVNSVCYSTAVKMVSQTSKGINVQTGRIVEQVFQNVTEPVRTNFFHQCAKNNLRGKKFTNLFNQGNYLEVVNKVVNINPK